MSGEISRREFLKLSSAIIGGAVLGGVGALAGEKIPEPEAHGNIALRILGRTKLKVTEVSFGGIQIQDPKLLEAAIDKGINLIHTSPGYGRGRSIRIFGEVMKTKRKKVYLALKKSPINGIDEELKILNTDYVDILVPPLHSVEAMNDPRLPEAFEKLKKEGKIRFSGFSCHKNIVDVMNRAIELGFFDVMLIAYNLANRDQIDPVLERAKKEQNMGFMVMKSMRGLDRKKPEVVAAGLKKLLQNKNVDTLLIGTSNVQELERNIAVAGKRLTKSEASLLDRYVTPTLASLCTMCGKCSVCPQGVEIADIMRCGAYLERGELELAKEEYRTIPISSTALNCRGCGTCESVCPQNINIREEIRKYHYILA